MSKCTIVTDERIRKAAWDFITDQDPDSPYSVGLPTDSEDKDAIETGGAISTFVVVAIDTDWSEPPNWYRVLECGCELPSTLYAVRFGVACNTGFEFLMAIDKHEQPLIWGAEEIEYGADGPAYCGDRDHESRIDMIKWINNLPNEINTDPGFYFWL